MTLFSRMSRNAVLSVALSSLVLMPSSVFADEGVASLDLAALMDLDIVVAATGKATSLKDAPSIVSVINDKEIRASGFRTVGEALRSVPGLSVIDDHVDTGIGIRGFFANSDSASDILKLMINSQPVAFRPTSSNFFGFDLIPIEAVKRIEIIRGPASSLYGANAFLGVVNVVTKTGAEVDDSGVGGALSGEGYQLTTANGSSMNKSMTTLLGGRSDAIGLEWMVSGTRSEADRSGLEAPSADGASPGWGTGVYNQEALLGRNPTAGDTAMETSAYGSLAFEIGEYGEGGVLRTDFHVQKRDKAGEFLPDTALTHKTRVALQNMFARLAYESERPEADGFYWDVQVSYADSTPLAADALHDEKDVDSERDLYYRRDFDGNALSAALELNYAFSDTDTVTFGFDYDKDTENLLTATRVFRGEERDSDGYGERVFENTAAYGQIIWNLMEGLTVTTGARLDHNSSIVCNSTDDWDCFGEQTVELTEPSDGFGQGDVETAEGGTAQMSSRLALVYHPPEFELWFIEDFYLKIAYGSSYKAPTPYQLYHKKITGKGSQGSPALTPQTADTVEAQIGLDFSGNVAFTVGWFTMDTKNLVISVKEEGAQYPSSYNADAHSTGLEFTLDWKVGKWLKLKSNMSYLMAANMTPRKPLDSTDSQWEYDPTFNVANVEGVDAFPASRYPTTMANIMAIVTLEDYYTQLGLNIHHVGERNASFANNGAVFSLDLTDTYQLPAYTLLRANLSTTGVYLISDYSETVFSVMYQGAISGTQTDSGFGGVDIPGFESSLFMKMTQNF